MMEKHHDHPTSPADGARPQAWNAHWHLIPRAQVQAINRRLATLAENRTLYEQLSDALEVSACIEFPLGELFNPRLKGFLWVWNLTNRFSRPYATEQSKSSFSAQGIEGLIRVEDIPLTVALRAAEEIDPYRVALSIREPWPRFARTLARHGLSTERPPT